MKPIALPIHPECAGWIEEISEAIEAALVRKESGKQPGWTSLAHSVCMLGVCAPGSIPNLPTGGSSCVWCRTGAGTRICSGCWLGIERNQRAYNARVWFLLNGAGIIPQIRRAFRREGVAESGYAREMCTNFLKVSPNKDWI